MILVLSPKLRRKIKLVFAGVLAIHTSSELAVWAFERAANPVACFVWRAVRVTG